jgi:hypothetical protein
VVCKLRHAFTANHCNSLASEKDKDNFSFYGDILAAKQQSSPPIHPIRVLFTKLLFEQRNNELHHHKNT